MFADLNITRT